jgi:uncharacterized membrane protein YkvA (DUF1232 family)
LLRRREDVRAVATLIPDCIVLVLRLARDSRVPRRRKLLLLAAAGYLALPFDLIPDFIPVLGQLNDVLVVAVLLRLFVRRDEALIREVWPGSDRNLGLLLRATKKPQV